MALPRIDIGLDRDERLPAVLLLIFFVVLCLAGGASREDVIAQSVIRGCAALLMAVQVLFGRLPDLRRYKACAWLLGAMIGVVLMQLVPLPPAIWTVLPGRELIASSPGGSTMWRPINMVPDAGWNALFSLLVPLCVLLLLSSLRDETVRQVRYVLAAVIAYSAVFALLQAAGSAPDNGLINGSTDQYAGIFANRNHQALFLAIGIGLAWSWGLDRGGSRRNWQLWLAICVISLFGISILVTGSRSGALLGALAFVAAPALALSNRNKPARGAFSSPFFWTAISIGLVALIVAVSGYFGRSQSLDRAVNLSATDDFRLRSLTTVWQIAKTYFPFGAGMGSFDAVFRIAEPFALLEPTYFNHAHDDLLEAVIETGVSGVAIMMCAVAWLGRSGVIAFSHSGASARLGRSAALTIILVILASISDYPARTPMIMATVMVAGCWLSDATRKARIAASSGALPSAAKPL
ncbi:MAG: O-antigen ligase family protein [Pseudomonadota bacterium]